MLPPPLGHPREGCCSNTRVSWVWAVSHFPTAAGSGAGREEASMKHALRVYMRKAGGACLRVAGLPGGTEGVNRRVEGGREEATEQCAEVGGHSQG